MTLSTCVRCESRIFELVEAADVMGANYVLTFIQCASCGGVVGVQEFLNTGAVLDKLGVAIKMIAKSMDVYVDLP